MDLADRQGEIDESWRVSGILMVQREGWLLPHGPEPLATVEVALHEASIFNEDGCLLWRGRTESWRLLVLQLRKEYMEILHVSMKRRGAREHKGRENSSETGNHDKSVGHRLGKTVKNQESPHVHSLRNGLS